VDTDEEEVVEYLWSLSKVSESEINLELEFLDPYGVSVGDVVHMLQVIQ
jgi:hypothetical protein